MTSRGVQLAGMNTESCSSAAVLPAGWRFNGRGQCVNIPQLSDEQALHNAVSSRKACVKPYPTQANTLAVAWASKPCAA